MKKTIKKAQVGVKEKLKQKSKSSDLVEKKYPSSSKKSQASSNDTKKSSVPKKPMKYYSEYDAGRGKFDKPRTEKEQKQWEKDELDMIDYPGRPKMKTGGALKPVPSDKQKSLGQLPTPVRNKMGYQKTGGKTKAKSGAALKKQAATAIAMKKAGKSPKKMMGGGKCKYGCK